MCNAACTRGPSYSRRWCSTFFSVTPEGAGAVSSFRQSSTLKLSVRMVASPVFGVATPTPRFLFRHTPVILNTSDKHGDKEGNADGNGHVRRNYQDAADDGLLDPSGNRDSSNREGGFREEAIVVKDEKGNSLVRVRRQPLSLIEEVPVPMRVYTEIELVMMAWSEEHAHQMRIMLMIIRLAMTLLVILVLYMFYRTQLSSERMVRGVDNVPSGLRIGNVVYFDMTEDGVDIGRIVIGLLNEDCPLYCEYFHRRCTGSGGNGDSFRGMHLSAMLPRHVLIFGDGVDMTHDVVGFDPHALPTEKLSQGAWRGALSSISTGLDKESPNFVIHTSAGDYKPQVFGLVIGGYNVVERINRTGTKHGNTPKRDYTIEGCGELCTLAKSNILPLPWRLYESVSRGFDEEKFGHKYGREVIEESDARSISAAKRAEGNEQRKRKRFWLF